VAGSVAVGRVTSDRGRTRAVLWGLGVTAAMVVAQGVAPAYWCYLVFGAVLGGTNSLCNGSLGALMMTRTTDADRGKVGSAMNGISRFFSITALMLGGLVGSLVGPRTTFVIGGVAGMLVIAAAAVWLRRRAVRDPAPVPVPAVVA
jgi:MFS family permease